jgi:hypothetical protein
MLLASETQASNPAAGSLPHDPSASAATLPVDCLHSLHSMRPKVPSYTHAPGDTLSNSQPSGHAPLCCVLRSCRRDPAAVADDVCLIVYKCARGVVIMDQHDAAVDVQSCGSNSQQTAIQQHSDAMKRSASSSCCHHRTQCQ